MGTSRRSSSPLVSKSSPSMMQQMMHKSVIRTHLFTFIAAFTIWFFVAYIIEPYMPLVFYLLTKGAFTVAIGLFSIQFVDTFKRYFLPLNSTDTSDKAVLVTGCASGFGYGLAQKLDERGFKVFAACRNITDHRAKKLVQSCSNRLQLVKMDVTDEDQVKEATDLVKSKLGNKRIMLMEGVEFNSDLSSYKRMMETNGFGVVRVVRSFLPLLRQQQDSRIVITSSQASRTACPSLGAYSMSKFALRGWADALRREVYIHGVHVSMVEPDFYETSLLECGVDGIDYSFSNSSEEVKAAYSEKEVSLLKSQAQTMMMTAHKTPEDVVYILDRAVSMSRQPDNTYSCCSYSEGMLFKMCQSLPTELTDPYLSGKGHIFTSNFFIITAAVEDKIRWMWESFSKSSGPKKE